MPTVNQALQWLEHQRRKGKGDMHVPHLVLLEEEDEKRRKNEPDEQTGKPKTRIVWDAGAPEMFSKFHEQRLRYLKASGMNTILATQLMAEALESWKDDEELKKYADGG